MKICKNCGNEHDGSYGSGIFCSKHCRYVYIGKQNKHPVCNWTKNNTNRRAPFGRWKCCWCDIIFETRSKLIDHKHKNHQKNTIWNKGLTKETNNIIKNASETLKKHYAQGLIKPSFLGKKHTEESKQKCGKGGGYKHGSGRGKQGWYKGYWCDSSWELAYVIYNLEHNIQFIRNKEGFEYEFENKKYKYYPDFILEDGTYVEIKGYLDKRNEIKIKSFDKKLIIIDKKDIKQYINYVVEKYGKDYIKLYDEK